MASNRVHDPLLTVLDDIQLRAGIIDSSPSFPRGSHPNIRQRAGLALTIRPCIRWVELPHDLILKTGRYFASLLLKASPLFYVLYIDNVTMCRLFLYVTFWNKV